MYPSAPTPSYRPEILTPSAAPDAAPGRAQRAVALANGLLADHALGRRPSPSNLEALFAALADVGVRVRTGGPRATGNSTADAVAASLLRLLGGPRDVVQLRVWCTLLLAAHHLAKQDGWSPTPAPFAAFDWVVHEGMPCVRIVLDGLASQPLFVPVVNFYAYDWAHVDPRDRRWPMDAVLDVGTLWGCVPRGREGAEVTKLLASVLTHAAEQPCCPTNRRLPLQQAAGELTRVAREAFERLAAPAAPPVRTPAPGPAPAARVRARSADAALPRRRSDPALLRAQLMGIWHREVLRRGEAAGRALAAGVETPSPAAAAAQDPAGTRAPTPVPPSPTLCSGYAPSSPSQGRSTPELAPRPNGAPVPELAPRGKSAPSPRSASPFKDAPLRRSASRGEGASSPRPASPTEDALPPTSVPQSQSHAAPASAVPDAPGRATLTWPTLPEGPAALVAALLAAPAKARDALLASADAPELARLARTAIALSAQIDAADAAKAALLVADAVRLGPKAQHAARRDQVLGILAAGAPPLGWILAATLPRKLVEDLAPATASAFLAQPPQAPSEAQRKVAEAWLRRISGDPGAAARLLDRAEGGVRALMEIENLQLVLGRTLVAAGTAAPEPLIGAWVRAAAGRQAEAILPVLDNLSLEHPVFAHAIITYLDLFAALPARDAVAIGELLVRKLSVKRGVAAGERHAALEVMAAYAAAHPVLWQKLPWHTPAAWSVFDGLVGSQRAEALRGALRALGAKEGPAAADRAAALAAASRHVNPSVALQVGVALFAAAPHDVALARAVCARIEALGRWLDAQQDADLGAADATAMLRLTTLAIDRAEGLRAHGVDETAGMVYAALDAQAFFLPQLLVGEHYLQASQMAIFAHLSSVLAPESLQDVSGQLIEQAGAYACMAFVNAVQDKLGPAWGESLPRSGASEASRRASMALLRRAEPAVGRFCATLLTHLAYHWARDPAALANDPHGSRLERSEVLQDLLGGRQQFCAWQAQEEPVLALVRALRNDPRAGRRYVDELLAALADEAAPLAQHHRLLPGIRAALAALPAGVQRRHLAESFQAAVLAAGERVLRQVDGQAGGRPEPSASNLRRHPGGPRAHALRPPAGPSAADAQARAYAVARFLTEASEILQPALLDFSGVRPNAKQVQLRRARQCDAIKYAHAVAGEANWRVMDAILRNFAATGTDAEEVIQGARFVCTQIFERIFAEQDERGVVSHCYNWLAIAYAVQRREPALRALPVAIVDAIADAARGQAGSEVCLPVLHGILAGDAEAPSCLPRTDADTALLRAMQERLIARAIVDNVDLARDTADIQVSAALRDTAAAHGLSLRLATLLRYDEAGRDRDLAAVCADWPALAPVTQVRNRPVLDAFDYALIDGELRMQTLRSLVRHGANSATFNAELVRRMDRACPIDDEERALLCQVPGVELFYLEEEEGTSARAGQDD